MRLCGNIQYIHKQLHLLQVLISFNINTSNGICCHQARFSYPDSKYTKNAFDAEPGTKMHQIIFLVTL